MDGADGPQCDRRGRRTAGGSIRFARSRREVLPIIRHAVEGRWCKRAQTAGTVSQPERFAERWVRSVNEECSSRLILFGEVSLRRALVEFVAHYHSERPHQGKGNVT